MENILDRSESYLRIFTENFRVDKTLPKWLIIQTGEKDLDKARELIKNGKNKINIKDGQPVYEIKNQTFNNENAISLNEFLNFDSTDYNIYIGKKIAQNLNKKQSYSSFDFGFSNSLNSDNEIKGNSIIKTVKRIYRTFVDKITGEEETEEVIEFDIFKFFEQVKLTSKENQRKYVERIEPYMIALKQANELGQKALADKLTAEIFNNKYESILYAENFHYKITEEELVYFVKKTEKGVRLDYIENFVRPIPKEVVEIKKKADDLLVFDNYCILHYDPELKSYKQTKEQEEELRRKKSDPILFGMINGSRNLYYVCDWIDEYCNLTLEEFVKVSGISKEHLKINEKINL